MNHLESIPLAVNLEPPRDSDGYVLSGLRFAASVFNLLADPLCILPPHVRSHVTLVAQYAELTSAPEPPGQDWRAQLAKIDSKYLSIIRSDADPSYTTWLRIAALNSCIPDKHLRSTPGTSTGATCLYKLLAKDASQQFVGKARADLRAVAEYYNARLRNGTQPELIPAPASMGRLDRNTADAFAFALIALFKEPIPRPATPRPPRKWNAPTVGGAHHSASPAPFLFGPDLPDLFDLPPTIIAPRGGDEKGDDPTKNHETRADQLGESIIYENWLAEHWATVHLAGALLPGTDRSFTKAESLAVARKLVAICAEGDRHTVGSICALTYLICIYTCQPRQSVLGALALLAMEEAGHDKRDAAWIDWDAFECSVPGAEKFGAVRRNTEHCLFPVEQSFSRDWPPFLKSSLGRLPRREESTWKMNEDGWNRHFSSLRSELLAVTPRFSEGRMLHILPVALFWSGQDTCIAQIATGQLLDHSSAPLHYRYYSLSDIHKGVHSATAGWLPPELYPDPTLPDAADSSTLIGAPRAAIRITHLQEAVGSLSKRYNAYKWHPHGPEKAVATFNLLVTTTVGAFAAAVAHRMTHHLSLLSLRDFLLRIRAGADGNTVVSLAIVFDKQTVNGLIFRVAVLPETVVRLFDALVAAIQDIRSEIKGLDGSEKVITTLNAILDGRASLFQLLHYNAEPTPSIRIGRARRKEVKNNWPALQIPVEHLRHAFTNHARLAGMSPHDIHRQAGHTLDFESFGQEDPDSPLLYATRNAPAIEQVIKEQGWEAIGIAAAASQKKFVLPDLTLTEVITMENAVVTRARSKLEKFRKKHAPRPADREAIKLAVEAVLAEQIPGYSAESPPVGIKLNAAAVARLEEAVHDKFEGFADLSVATRHLKMRIRRCIEHHKWTSPYLPRVVFRKAVYVPVITPTIPRAYRTAEAILAWADTELSKPLYATQDGIRRPTSWGLAQAIVQLAVRGGIVTEQRLLGCIRGLATAIPHRNLSDAVILNIRSDSVLDGFDDEHPDDETGRLLVGTPEAIVLSGPCALMALGWKKAGIDCSEVTFEALRAACDHLPKARFVGSLREDQTILQLLLRVAGIARRLTQPGVRSAWEEDRLAARSFTCEREEMIRHNLVRSHPGEADTVLPALAAKRQRPRISNNPDAKFLRWMRRNIHAQFSERARAKRIPLLSHQALAESILTELQKHKDVTRTTRTFVAFFISRLQTLGDGALTTLYCNLTIMLEPLLFELAGADVCALEGDELADLVVRTVLRKSLRPRKGTLVDSKVSVHSKLTNNAKRTFSQLRLLLDFVVQHGGAEVDQEDLAELDFVQRIRGPAYVLGEAEYLGARAQLERWAVVAEDQGPGASEYHPSEYRAAQHLLMFSFRGGLRVGESKSRQIRDLVPLEDDVVLLIRRHRGYTLKTLSANRAISLKVCVPSSELESFRAWVKVRRATPGPSGRDDALLFSLPLDPEYNIERLAHLARVALAEVTDQSRMHGGRKSIACGSTEDILNRLVPGTLPQYAGLQHASWLATANHLEPAIFLMYVARMLGQASATTTLAYYVHVIAYMTRTDEGWPRLAAEPATRLATNVRYDTLRVTAHRKGTSLKDVTAARLIELSGLLIATPSLPPAMVPVEPHDRLPRPGRVTTQIGYLRLAEAMHALAVGKARAYVEAQYGISRSAMNEWLRWLDSTQYHYRLWVLRIDPNLEMVEKANDSTRVPRLRDVQTFCRNCDLLRNQDPMTWAQFARLVTRQRRLNGTLVADSADVARTAAAVLENLGATHVLQTDKSKGRVMLQIPQVATLRFVSLLIALEARLAGDRASLPSA